ncbi:MAG: hypothetical protein AAFS10_14155, partial [Myxococcota bacterium]
MALALARRAFHINPMDAQVRAALRQAAEASDSAQDLDQVRNVVDDVELGRLLKDHDMDLANRYEAIGWELGDDSDSQDHAVEVLEAMSSEVSDERIEAALLRRASEIASGLGLARRAAELSQRAVAARSDDVLALRASLEALVSDQRFAEAADLLIQTSRPFPVSEATATRLVQAAYDLEQNGDDDRAAALYQCAVGGLPRRGDALLDVLDRLGTVLKRRDDAWLWRNILERLLHEDDVAIDLEGELHMRLGHVYQDLLPEPERAAEHLQSALRSPNTRARALEELSAIYGRGDRYDALAQVLRNLIDEPNPGSDKGERKAAYREALAHILSHHLNDPVQARQVLTELLAERPRHLEALRSAAALDQQLGHYDDMAAVLEQASRLIEDQAERSRTWFAVGQIHEQHLGNIPKALESYMVGFICDNTNREAFARLEALYREQGRWRELVGIYDIAADAARRDPDSAWYREQMIARKAQVEFMNLERPRIAASSFLVALRLNPTEERYVKLIEAIHREHPMPDRLAEAYMLIIGALDNTDTRRRPLMHQLAQLRLDQGQDEVALEVYQALLEEWPADDEAAQHIETTYQRNAQWDALIAFYRERIRSAPSAEAVTPLRWSIARVAERKLRDMDLAIETYESILELAPGDIEVLRAMGRLLEATRQWDRLLEISEREVRLTESPRARANIYFRIGSIHETVHHDLEQAIACYERAVGHDPGSAPALHGLREIYQRQQRWDKVIETFEREAALWHEPRERASIFAMMADIYADHLDNPERAERLLRDALALNPEATAIAQRLLDIILRQERWEDAEIITTALTRDGAPPLPEETRSDLFRKRALVAERLGQDVEAVNSLRIALDINPRNTEALHLLLQVMG